MQGGSERVRIALISAWSEAEDGADPALIAGRSAARRQVDLAIALGCERIACLAAAPSREIVRMQHAAERAGLRFNAITGSRALAGLVKSSDELLVIAPHLVAEASFVVDALGNRPGMLVVPAERGVAAGFERIDRDHAWAGVLLVHGAVVDRLCDLPPDSDPTASLLRISAQAGIRRVLLAPVTLDSGELALVVDETARKRAEKRWLDRGGGRIGWRKPLSAAVGQGVRLLAPRLLASSRVVPGADIAATTLAIGAGILSWLDRPAMGLAVLATAAAGYLSARRLGAFIGGSPLVGIGGWWREALLDGVFAASVVAASPRDPGPALFAALVAIVAVRLSAIHGPDAPAAPASDRILVFAIAAISAAFGSLLPAVQLFAAAALAIDLFLRIRERG